MTTPYITKSIIFTAFFVTFTFGDCGSCTTNTSPEKFTQKATLVNTLVTSVPQNGEIEGLVITSCGKCRGWNKTRSCNLTVKIGDKTYPVKGSNIHAHGNAHSGEGLCSSVRIARVKGKMKDDVLIADSFVLIGR